MSDWDDCGSDPGLDEVYEKVGRYEGLLDRIAQLSMYPDKEEVHPASLEATQLRAELEVAQESLRFSDAKLRRALQDAEQLRLQLSNAKGDAERAENDMRGFKFVYEQAKAELDGCKKMLEEKMTPSDIDAG